MSSDALTMMWSSKEGSTSLLSLFIYYNNDSQIILVFWFREAHVLTTCIHWSNDVIVSNTVNSLCVHYWLMEAFCTFCCFWDILPFWRHSWHDNFPMLFTNEAMFTNGNEAAINHAIEGTGAAKPAKICFLAWILSHGEQSCLVNPRASSPAIRTVFMRATEIRILTFG